MRGSYCWNSHDEEKLSDDHEGELDQKDYLHCQISWNRVWNLDVSMASLASTSEIQQMVSEGCDRLNNMGFEQRLVSQVVDEGYGRQAEGNGPKKRDPLVCLMMWQSAGYCCMGPMRWWLRMNARNGAVLQVRAYADFSTVDRCLCGLC